MKPEEQRCRYFSTPARSIKIARFLYISNACLSTINNSQNLLRQYYDCGMLALYEVKLLASFSLE